MSTQSRHLRRTLATLGVAFMLHACATVPETGRSQLILVSSADVMQLSLSEFDKLKRSTPISGDADKKALVERVGHRIAAVAPLPNAKWEFVLFDKPDVQNAFALPGGKVGVYSGLLAVTQNEAGLATVMAHEVAHALARHGEERISQGLLVQLGGQALGAALRTQPETTQQLALAAFGVGSNVAYMLPHSRAQELEADRIGLTYMARAGYDPHEAVAFWKRFGTEKQKRGGKAAELLSTHPLDEKRIAQLESLMPEAVAEYQKARR